MKFLQWMAPAEQVQDWVQPLEIHVLSAEMKAPWVFLQPQKILSTHLFLCIR